MSKLLAAALALAAAASFRPALPGWKYEFPRDHAAHPEFKTEWWYYTGNVRAADGRELGFQLTFFRVGVPPTRPLAARPSRWRAGDVHLAHFAVSDPAEGAFRFQERLQRGGVGLAWALNGRYEVVNGSWSARLDGSTHRLSARGGGEALELALDALKPPVIHGHGGISKKSACPTCASHYYSLTRMRTRGTLTVGGRAQAVEGLAWMDHEWGSNQLADDEVGWDWFSLQLDDGSELMLYHLRRSNGLPVPESSGTFVAPDGTWKHLALEAFEQVATGTWVSPASNGRYPMGWRVRVPGERLALTVEPVMPDQELRTRDSAGEVYWEGSVRVKGTRAGKPVGGRGYVELTGYAGRFKAAI